MCIRDSHHAIHQVGLDDILADLAFIGLVGRHRAVRQHEAGDAGRRQVMDEVLHPGAVSYTHLTLPTSDLV